MKKIFSPSSFVRVSLLIAGLFSCSVSLADWRNSFCDDTGSFPTMCRDFPTALEACQNNEIGRGSHRLGWVTETCAWGGGFYNSTCETSPGVGVFVCIIGEVFLPSANLVVGYLGYPRPTGTCKLAGGNLSSSQRDCVKVLDVKPKNFCPADFGNPIQPLTGSKTQVQDLGANIGNLVGSIRYDSKPYLPYAAGTPTVDGSSAPIVFNDFGAYWRSSFNKYIELVKNGATVVGVNYWDEAGHSLFFASSDGLTFSNTTTKVRVVPNPNGDGYIVIAEDGAQDVFSLSNLYKGRHPVKSSVSATGRQLTFEYSVAVAANAPELGLLTKIQDDADHLVSFVYAQGEGSPPKITSLSNSDGLMASFSYTGSRLDLITWADGKVRRFLYELSTLPWALTGIVDENNDRHSTYSYDDQGYATGTALNAGSGAESQVNSYSASYSTKPVPTVLESYDAATNTLFRTHGWTAAGSASVLLPNGQTTSLASTNIDGANVLVGQSQPAGSGCAASNSATSYDARGNVIFKDDFDGSRVCYSYDATDHVTAKIEGLAASMACPSPDTMALPAGARMSRSQWVDNLVVKNSAPGSLRTTVYHGQVDPLNNNTIASCAPAGAQTPDGKPIAVLCKQVVQATTDANGSLGLAATLDSGVAQRVSGYTYDSAGRVLTSTNSFGDTTTYVYYATTAFTGTGPSAVGVTVGDLQSITGPTGHVTSFNAYDKLGRVLQMTDANGIVTNKTYTSRGWVNTASVTPPGGSARTTTYSYDNVGQVIGVSNPDGTTLGFTYDSAHRLVGATDARGNSVSYSLDSIGNRVIEQLRDPSGTLLRSVQRTFDDLNRVQQMQIQDTTPSNT